MLKRRKSAEIKRVIDVEFEVKRSLEEDKEGYIAYLVGIFKKSSERGKGIMPLTEGISKISTYIQKLPRAPQPALTSREVWLSLWGTIFGIGITALLAFTWKCPMLLGSFGSTAPLLYCAYKSPLAQPRNVVLGHFIGASIGVTINDFFGVTWWSIALAVALAVVLMFVTYSIHPPAGATAYVAIQTGGLGVGYWFILNPTMLGIFMMVTVAVIFNKLGKREYPLHWL
ncbi:MAG: HPP family protein [Candidatus Brocadia sp.]|nr:HPP family protein [Candidatus Brocadia sp.]MCE7911053.1 HPP family protein [Candidatus Brocadia sp. AMX3]MDG5996327.1 HPP family protein [Candidatus Brocadia sp.]RIJ94394.1 MAG: HPP family protein [Candidatus Brocadia sp.]